MSDNIIQLNQELIHNELKDLVRNSVEETLNALLDHEAEQLVNAEKYERSGERKGYRSGHYNRNFQTTSGDVTLKVPKLKGVQFETAIIERYRRRECSVEEALIEMYLAGVSVRRVEDITEALWGTKVSPGTISNLNKKAYEHIETWRTRKLEGEYPYVYVDGVYLKRSWGGEVQNVSILVAIGVNQDGCREIIGAAEGMKEDRESWKEFFVWLKERGLKGVRLIVGDKCLGMLESIPEVFPDAKYQRCTVHFYRNIFSVTPRNRMKTVAMMLKAIHAQESKEAAREKAEQVAATRVAPPGTSEHNTGLAVDILSGDYYNHHGGIEESFEYDAEAIWMKAHCAEYGFILRYPKGKQDITGIIFEPWHFRYVGVEAATYIMENDLTLEEYLGAA